MEQFQLLLKQLSVVIFVMLFLVSCDGANEPVPLKSTSPTNPVTAPDPVTTSPNTKNWNSLKWDEDSWS